MSGVIAEGATTATTTDAGKAATQTTETKAAETKTETATTKAAETKAAATETKAATETVKADATKATAATAPEKYEFKVREGKVLDAALIERASPIFRELGLSQEQATKLHDLFEDYQDGNLANWNRQRDEQAQAWMWELLKDKDFGGPKADATMKDARSFLGTFDPDGAFREWIKAEKLDNFPPLIKMLARASVHLKEDTFHGGSPNGSGELTQQEKDAAMYPSMQKK